MTDLYLIRHGETPGNRLKRYIGMRTDEELSPEGESALYQINYEEVDLVIASPMKRCLRTAEILFPGKKVFCIEELMECDFGRFENKNYQELSGDTEYQAWIDSNAALPFPGGESREAFRSRSIIGFEKLLNILSEEKANKAAAVLHGGTIMNLMEAYGEPKRSFYEWHLKNGEGFHVIVDTEMWSQGKKELLLSMD